MFLDGFVNLLVKVCVDMELLEKKKSCWSVVIERKSLSVEPHYIKAECCVDPETCSSLQWCHSKMLNISELPLQLLPSRASDRLLQPFWDYLLFHHRPLISSPFFIVLLAFSSYFFFSIPFAALDLLGERAPLFYQYKIQPDRRPTVGMMAKSFMTAMYNHIFFVLPAVMMGTFILPIPTLPQDAPTLYEVFIDGLAMLLLFDTQYYIWHFIHHKHAQLYRWIHAIHHEYMAPFSWSTEQLSIPELMTVGLWSNQDPILLKCHPMTTWGVTVFSIWMSVEDHIGYDLPWTLNHLVPFGLLGGAPAHDMHHQKPSSNYAPFFSHWDRIFGTAVPLKKKTIRK
ncbi:cholesterol 25-hydroxylase-like protein 1, member 1 [Sebastes fasciatus]|uniref:cholesterol 25-hydroxylase-like protein 1, member 1 n=1 Tax=Sebastes fasciatus TaxID=394691 RepID=UPI003D9DE10A